MEQPPSLDQVLQQLAALYVSSDVNLKGPASKWLEELQRSVHAWEISNQLLRLRQDNVSCYFAASTMKTKILSSFHELPAENHPMLRETLLSFLAAVPETSTRTQLCLAVAYLAIQMARWKDPISQLCTELSKDRSLIPALLQTLTYICEEAGNDRLRIGLNRRNEVHDMLKASCASVFGVLETVLSSFGSDAEVCRLCMACTGSWLRLCAVPADALMRSSLVTIPFEVRNILQQW